MDVILPEIYTVDGIAYRRNPSRRGHLPIPKTLEGVPKGHRENSVRSAASSNVSGAASNSTGLKPYVEEDAFGYECDPDAPDAMLESEALHFEVEAVPNSSGFRTRVDTVPAQLYGIIIGKQGQTRSRIERETRTKITVPGREERGGHIVIRGQKREDVIAARRRVEILASRGRDKSSSTHFPCFPLNSLNIVQKVKEFQNLVLQQNFPGIDETLFVKPETAHLTICMVKLFDEKERVKSADILKGVKDEIKGTLNHSGPVLVQIKDLEYMNDDPSQVDVLYAKCYDVDGTSGLLQRIADLVAQRFKESGFSTEDQGEHVKLHCTIMNSRKRAEALAAEQGGADNGGRVRRESFDARPVFQKFKNFDFGVIEITDIKLATRFTTGPDGFYKSYCSIEL